jgi:hypothetical protein
VDAISERIDGFLDRGMSDSALVLAALAGAPGLTRYPPRDTCDTFGAASQAALASTALAVVPHPRTATLVQRLEALQHDPNFPLYAFGAALAVGLLGWAIVAGISGKAVGTLGMAAAL